MSLIQTEHLSNSIWSKTNLDVRSLNYSEICALRDENLRPQVLSAGVVLICKETEELILNRRSNDVATYFNKLHIYAGAYIPEGTRDPDRASLFSTISREIHEETHMYASTHDVQAMMMSEVDPIARTAFRVI